MIIINRIRIIILELNFKNKVMNTNKSNYTTGIILIVLGLFIFGLTNEWFSFEVTMRQIARFWPLFIVAGGLAVFLNDKKTIYNPLTALLIAFAIPLGIYHGTTRAIDDVKTEFEDGFNIDMNTDDDDNLTDNSRHYGDTTGMAMSKTIEVPFDSKIQNVNLEFKGGAAEFFLSESAAANTFETESNNKITNFTLEDEKNGNSQDINVDMELKNRHIKLGKKDYSNDVTLKLNKTPNWDIDLSIGAGKLDFDLSDYKIKNIDLKTGAADVSLKVGSKMPETTINIESGVASINLDIPKEVGCEVRMEGALNSNDFTGFTKVSSGLWQTENYKSATKKVIIKLESGLSAVDIDRY
jgi:Domain of unknown function (DUF5668)